MLRSNRKNSPASSNGTSLPTHYNGTESNGTVPRRRRRNGKDKPHNICCCSKWAFFLLTVSCVGSLFLVHRSETAVHHIHKAIRKTWADPAPPLHIYDPLIHRLQRRAQAASPILPPQPPHNGVYDIVVLGAGPAGLTAALFAARAGLSVLVFGSDAGSLSETHRLENFPSWQLEGGPLWLQTTKQQAAQWGATFAQAGLLVEKLSPRDEDVGFGLKLSNSMHTNARSVIVATGATGRRLGLPLEEDLWGKSVHSCAVCDGSSYVHKIVVVVGGGDAAVDGALLLARYAKQVILVHRRNELRASNSRSIELLKTTPNIRMELAYTVAKFETTRSKNHNNNKAADIISVDHHVLTAVDLQHTETGATQRITCDGVFELIGSTPNTNWLKGSNINMDGEGFLTLANLSVETRTATSMEGVFAAGEVTDQIYRQAITAAAEGAEAAMDAERWLRNHPEQQNGAIKQQQASIPLQTVLAEDKDTAQMPPPEPVAAKLKPPEEDECDLTQQECIHKLVNKFPVVVFSKPWCGYCRKALEALAAEGLPEGNDNLHVVDLSLFGPQMRLVQGTLQSMTGRRTVPNVFVGGTSIGGGDETSKFHREGKLHDMLVEAKAIDGAGSQEKENPCDDLTQEACITRLVNQYPVVIFTKPGCPHCRRAFEALALDGLPKQSHNLYIVDLGPMDNKARIQDRLEMMTGRRTVPNVFVGGRSIGGGSETTKFQKDGKLRSLLKKAHAIEASR